MEELGAEATWLALEYIRGHLSDIEMKEVEARMANDRAFYSLVRDLRTMQNAHAGDEDGQVDARVMAAAEAFFAAEKPKQRVLRWQWWMGSAAAAILICAVLFFSLRSDSYVDRYFEAAAREQTLGSADPADLLRTGMNLYANKKYEEAIRNFESVPDTSQGYNTANFFLANAYLALGKLEAALKPLRTLEQMNDRKYLDGRRWLLALIYLDQGEQQKGEKALQDLIDDQTSLYKESEAREILGR